MDFVPEKKINPDIKRVIGIMNVKGGVGKYTVAVLFAQVDSQSCCEPYADAPANG